MWYGEPRARYVFILGMCRIGAMYLRRASFWVWAGGVVALCVSGGRRFGCGQVALWRSVSLAGFVLGVGRRLCGAM